MQRSRCGRKSRQPVRGRTVGAATAGSPYCGLGRTTLALVGKFAHVSGVPETLALPRGCFAKVRASVSAGVRGGFRAVAAGVVLAAVRRMGPDRAFPGPFQAPAVAIWWLWSFSRL